MMFENQQLDYVGEFIEKTINFKRLKFSVIGVILTFILIGILASIEEQIYGKRHSLLMWEGILVFILFFMLVTFIFSIIRPYRNILKKQLFLGIIWLLILYILLTSMLLLFIYLLTILNDIKHKGYRSPFTLLSVPTYVFLFINLLIYHYVRLKKNLYIRFARVHPHVSDIVIGPYNTKILYVFLGFIILAASSVFINSPVVFYITGLLFLAYGTKVIMEIAFVAYLYTQRRYDIYFEEIVGSISRTPLKSILTRKSTIVCILVYLLSLILIILVEESVDGEIFVISIFTINYILLITILRCIIFIIKKIINWIRSRFILKKETL